MKALLDTQVLLWAATDPSRLSAPARKVIIDPEDHRLLSVVSAWEIVIKVRLGKLKLPSSPERFLAEQAERLILESLPVTLAHVLQVYSLPDHHQDPFDRLLIAQAQVERLPIVSGDPAFRRYPVQVIW
ncbi:MAG: type II toxin-antitoxin system VapC family toxin [Acidobacteria bacterium]|nr:type II toxin-antitoxin system VapC family toxin [Acidobacteriota bacterium]